MNDLCTLNPSQIVIYTTQSCSDCHSAKAFFEANHIQFTQVGLEDNEGASEFVMNVNNGQKSVPIIIFPDGSVLVEPSWQELRQKIKNS